MNHNHIEYTKPGDYYLPNLTVPTSPNIGRFGRMRMQYLKANRRGMYSALLLKGTINSYLEEIDHQAKTMVDLLVEQTSRAEETVLNELIYN